MTDETSNEKPQKKAFAGRWVVPAAIAAATVAGGAVGAGVFGVFRSGHRAPAPGTAGRAAHRAAPPPKVDCRVRKCIALTFDDGPVPGTGRLLDILKAHGARATFFVLGSQVATNADMLKREIAEGHEVGNHTYTHAKLAGAPEAKAEEEIIRTQDAIRQVTGRTPTLFRPTYGATDKQLDAITKEEHLAQILWTVDTLDWRDRNTEAVTKRVLKSAKPGHIILMHDIRPTTVAAIPGILHALSAQGYAFVTISELYGGKLSPGEKYPPFLGSPTAGLAPPT